MVCVIKKLKESDVVTRSLCKIPNCETAEISEPFTNLENGLLFYVVHLN